MNSTLRSKAHVRFHQLSLAYLALSIAGCQPTEVVKPPTEVSDLIIRGQSITVDDVVWPKQVKCQGTLVAEEVTTIGAKVPGRIGQISVDLGDTVGKDDLLVQLDPREFQLQAQQADAQLLQARSAVGLKPGDPVEALDPDNAPPVREARAIWDEAKQAVSRIRQLSSKDAVSATDLEVSESAERVASARFSSASNGVREKIALIGVQQALRDLAHQRLDETKILAPFAGVVESRLIATGTYVQAGQALLTIAKTSTLRFRGSVPERYAQQIRIGQKIDLQFELSDQTRSIEITRISPSLDPMNRSLVFEADVDNADGTLRSGLFSEGVIILDPEAKGIAIPHSALVRFAGVDKVWKIINGSLKEQIVTLGRATDDLIEIRSGVSRGDRLLLNGKDGKTGKFEQEP